MIKVNILLLRTFFINTFSTNPKRAILSNCFIFDKISERRRAVLILNGFMNKVNETSLYKLIPEKAPIYN